MRNRPLRVLLTLGVVGLSTICLAQEKAPKKIEKEKKYPVDGIVHMEKRGHLGMSYAPSNRGMGRRRKPGVTVDGFPKEAGIHVMNVAEDSPAAKAGLKEGDVLMKINEQVLVNDDQLKALLNLYRDKEVKLQAFRKGEAVLNLKVTVETKEEEAIDWPLVRSLLHASKLDDSPQAKEFHEDLQAISDEFAHKREREQWKTWRARKTNDRDTIGELFGRTNTKKPRRDVSTLSGPEEELKSTATNADGTLMVTVTKDGRAILRDLKRGVRTEVQTGASVGVGAVTPDGTRMAFGNRSGDVLVYDVTNAKEPAKILAGDGSRLMDLAFSNDGSSLAICDLKKRITVYDTKTWKTLATTTCAFVQRALAFAGSETLVTVGIGKKVRIWSLKKGLVEINALSGHTFGVRCVAVSQDGTRAISGSDDMTVCLWNLETGTLIKRLEGHSSLIAGARFVDDTRAVSVSMDGKLICWNLKTGKSIRQTDVCDEGVNALAVASKNILVAGRDGKIYSLPTKTLMN